MTTPFDCSLYDVSLSSLDDSIAVTDIREAIQLVGQRRASITVEVRLCIHQEDPVLRREVISKVIAWAGQDGRLAVSDRPNQQLTVVCTSLPELSAADWLAELTLHFTSAYIPWWESRTQAMVSGNGILTVDVPGNAPSTAAEVLLVNTGTAVVTEFRLHCHMSEMAFSGVTMNPGSCFTLLYQDGHLLAQVDGESVLHCRTAQSSDELTLPCGQTSTVYATAPGESLQATFTVRGRYA